MLVRRFAVVCLMIALFGAGLSIVMTQARGQAGNLSNGAMVPCLFDIAPVCAQPQRARD